MIAVANDKPIDFHIKRIFTVIILRNLTAGAPWEPRFYRLNRPTGALTGVSKLGMSEHVIGFGSCLFTVSNGQLAKRLLGVYWDNEKWLIFDGEREVRIDEVKATWKAGPAFLGLGLASLKLEFANSVEMITYIRPWLRHAFEGGWTLTDIDIAWVVTECLGDEAARLRLLRSLGKV